MGVGQEAGGTHQKLFLLALESALDFVRILECSVAAAEDTVKATMGCNFIGLSRTQKHVP